MRTFVGSSCVLLLVLVGCGGDDKSGNGTGTPSGTAGGTLPQAMPPVATDDAGVVDEGGTIGVDLTWNDEDYNEDLDVATVAIVDDPAAGSVTVNPDGTADYTHDGSEDPTDTFTYTVSDAEGQVSNTATVTMTINPINDAPEAIDDAETVDEGGMVNVDLLANDVDVDGTLDMASIVVTVAPTVGTLVDNGDGTADYTHDGSEVFTDTFSYTVADDTAAVSNEAVVDITVTPVNDVPVAVDDYWDVDVSMGPHLIDLAGNDMDGDDGLDLASIAVVTPAVEGVVVVNGDGTITYTHSGGTLPADSFTYTISDMSGAVSNEATVTLTLLIGQVTLCDVDWYVQGPYYGLGYYNDCGIPGDEATSYWFDFDSGMKVAPYDPVDADLSKGHLDCCDWNAWNGALQADTGVPAIDFALVSCEPTDGFTYVSTAIPYGQANINVICIQTALGGYFKYIGQADCCGGITLDWERTW